MSGTTLREETHLVTPHSRCAICNDGGWLSMSCPHGELWLEGRFGHVCERCMTYGEEYLREAIWS